MVIAGPPLTRIVETIVAAVHPRRIVLFGSRARGDARSDSDVDLMVEMETPLGRQQRVYQIDALFPRRDWSMDVLVYTPAEIERQRDDPGTTVYSIVREGEVLYQRPDVQTEFRRPPRRVKESEEPPSVGWWLANADTDLRAIELMLAPADVPWNPVCFHAQQAGEKYLKALIIKRWRQPERTHDLKKLLETCRQLGYPLTDLDDDCRVLTPQAVAARYADDPFAPPPFYTEVDGRSMVAAMHRIVAAATAELGRGAP